MNYGFDTSGRFGALTSTVGSVQSAFAYSYVPDSDLLAGWGVGGGISFRRTYEPSRDLIATVTNTWNGTALGTFGYENDAIARRTKRVDSGVTTNAFGYNLRSEVASAIMGTNVYGYGYDPIGNRHAATNNAQALAYAANGLNQYTNIVGGGTVVPTYDDDGNMVGYGAWTFTWNGENRLVGASNGTVGVGYSYDFQGRMAERTVDGQARRYLWDGFNIVAEVGSAVTNRFVWGLDLSGAMQGAGGVGGLLAQATADAAGLRIDYAAYDANGNVTEYMASDGSVAARYVYDPFGRIVEQSGTMAGIFLHRFSTKPFEPETALVHYQFRPYSPELGRWLSRDPTHEAGGIPLYVIVGNSSVDSADSLGLVRQIPGAPWLARTLIRMGVEWLLENADTDVPIVETRSGPTYCPVGMQLYETYNRHSRTWAVVSGGMMGDIPISVDWQIMESHTLERVWECLCPPRVKNLDGPDDIYEYQRRDQLVRRQGPLGYWTDVTRLTKVTIESFYGQTIYRGPS